MLLWLRQCSIHLAMKSLKTTDDVFCNNCKINSAVWNKHFSSLFSLGGFDYEYVSCGSTLKLKNNYHGVRLHSHDVKYGSGSGQQVC